MSCNHAHGQASRPVGAKSSSCVMGATHISEPMCAAVHLGALLNQEWLHLPFAEHEPSTNSSILLLCVVFHYRQKHTVEVLCGQQSGRCCGSHIIITEQGLLAEEIADNSAGRMHLTADFLLKSLGCLAVLAVSLSQHLRSCGPCSHCLASGCLHFQEIVL